MFAHAGLLHQRLDALDRRDVPAGRGIVERPGREEVRRVLPDFGRVALDEPAGRLVPPGGIQRAAYDDGIVTIEPPDPAGRQEVDLESFGPEVVSHRLGDSLGASAFGTVRNQDPHRVPPSFLPRCERRPPAAQAWRGQGPADGPRVGHLSRDRRPALIGDLRLSPARWRR